MPSAPVSFELPRCKNGSEFASYSSAIDEILSCNKTPAPDTHEGTLNLDEILLEYADNSGAEMVFDSQENPSDNPSYYGDSAEQSLKPSPRVAETLLHTGSWIKEQHPTQESLHRKKQRASPYRRPSDDDHRSSDARCKKKRSQ